MDSQFAERMAQIRSRFAAKLTHKIDETDTDLTVLAGGGAYAVDVVAAISARRSDLLKPAGSQGGWSTASW